MYRLNNQDSPGTSEATFNSSNGTRHIPYEFGFKLSRLAYDFAIAIPICLLVFFVTEFFMRRRELKAPQ